MISYQEVGASLSARSGRKNEHRCNSFKLVKTWASPRTTSPSHRANPCPRVLPGCVVSRPPQPECFNLLCLAWGDEADPPPLRRVCWFSFVRESPPSCFNPLPKPTPASSAPSGCNYIKESMCAHLSPHCSPILLHSLALACSIILTWGDYEWPVTIRNVPIQELPKYMCKNAKLILYYIILHYYFIWYQISKWYQGL